MQLQRAEYMAQKQKKNHQVEDALQAQNSSSKSELSPWKTPTGIAALIGATAALITSLVAAILFEGGISYLLFRRASPTK